MWFEDETVTALLQELHKVGNGGTISKIHILGKKTPDLQPFSFEE